MSPTENAAPQVSGYRIAKNIIFMLRCAAAMNFPGLNACLINRLNDCFLRDKQTWYSYMELKQTELCV